MKIDDKQRSASSLKTPESDEPVPDSVERELEKPFEIDLSAWEMVKPSPGFVERVVQELMSACPASMTEETPPESGATALKRGMFVKRPARSAASARRSGKDRPRPSGAVSSGALPPERRAPGAPRR